MSNPKEILDIELKCFYNIYNEKTPDKAIPFIIRAMQLYAEEYNRTELLKLNKSDVISSVCDHKFDDIDVNYVDGIIICNRCHVKLEG